MPRLLLINPAHDVSFWGLEHCMDLQGGKYSNAPLAILTVAALTPDHWEVELVDENVDSIDFDHPCDVVGITTMNVQAQRAFVIADEFRRRGRLVAMGGPFPTLEPHRCEPHADVLFVGDSERTWPRFCRELEADSHAARYEEHEKIPLSESPTPRFDLVDPRDYGAMPIQTSRGCPYSCEFCDIIVMHGRRVRTKSVEQVLAEVRSVAEAGGDSIFFTDDNYIGNIKYARRLTEGLVELKRETNAALTFFTQVTLNLAEKPDLLALMSEAGFTRLFIGIETPRRESLLGAGKRQNTHGDMLERIGRLQHAGMMIWAGMIVGFDNDDEDVFEEQADFLDAAASPVAMIGMLNAPPRTPLYERLSADGRIDPSADWTDMCAWTNIVPKQMTRSRLFRGYRELLETVYDRDRYTRRVMNNIAAMRRDGARDTSLPSPGRLRALLRVARHSTLAANRAHRGYFVEGFLRTLQQQPERVVEASTALGMWKHFGTYVPVLSAQLREAERRERVREREHAFLREAGSARRVLPVVA